MRGLDSLGNPVTADSQATLSGVEDFVGGLLGYETRIVTVMAAAKADPDSCLVNAYAGAVALFAEAPGAAENAGRYLDRAERAARGATERERMVTAFIRLWQRDEIDAARRLGSEIAAAYPRDLALVKLHQYLSFNIGDAPAMLRIAHTVFERNRDVPYMHGIIAFAYEQCHLLDEAEAAAETALALRRKEPWAQHALAHISLSRSGRIHSGARFLESVEDTWDGLNSFMLTHLWWHLALFLLSEGRFDRVLEIYDRHCWGADKSYSQDQITAVSLLARIELAGGDVGDRWAELGTYLAARAGDLVLPFLTAQYLYGLARAGRPEAEILLAAVRRHAATGQGASAVTWRDVALPLCNGLHAHATGNFEAAVAGLREALPRLVEIGGSHAQRDLFDQIHLDALLRSGRLGAAQYLLEQRRQGDPDGVPVNRALAGLYRRLDLPTEAAQAEARAAAASGAYAA
jgi:hypothetical protein